MSDHPYVGMWVTGDGHVRQELLPNGRYDEARGTRRSAYQGRYEVHGNTIDYWDDTGFTADGEFVGDDVLHHGGMVFHRERLPAGSGTGALSKPLDLGAEDYTPTRLSFMTKLATVAGGLLAGSVLLGACAQEGSGGGGSDTAERERRNERLIREAFDRQVGGPDSFYAILAEDVEWTIAGAEPSTYTSRQQFFEEGSTPVTDRLSTPVRPTIRELYADGDVVVARWEGSATARDGQPYRNSYAWIMTLRDGRVSRVVAFLDLTAINDLFERVPRPE